MLVADFLRYTFLGKLNKQAQPTAYEDVEAVDEETIEGDLTGKADTTYRDRSEDLLRKKIIIQINRLVGFICLVSFVFIIVYTFIRPDKQIPDIIQNTFSMTLGYFVSALIAFLERKSQPTI